MNTETVERKKEKKLDRNHWMCRIQKYTFGIDAPTYYMGYCPFFWMTWLALVCLPVVFLGRLLAYPVLTGCETALEKYEDKKTAYKEKVNSVPLPPFDSELVALVQQMRIWDRKPEELKFYDVDCVLATNRNTRRVYLWFQENPNWKETHYPAAKERYDAQKAAEKEARQKAAEAKERRDKAFRKLANSISPISCAIFKFLIPTVLCSAAAAAIFGIGMLVVKIDLLTWLQVFLFLNGVAVISMMLYLAADFIKIYRETKTVTDKESWISRAITSFIEKVGAVIEFLGDTIRITYKQECPLILWGEETGPIQKRKK